MRAMQSRTRTPAPSARIRVSTQGSCFNGSPTHATILRNAQRENRSNVWHVKCSPTQEAGQLDYISCLILDVQMPGMTGLQFRSSSPALCGVSYEKRQQSSGKWRELR